MNIILNVGIAGCGKTTYSNQIENSTISTIVFSSDDYRKQLFGDENNQKNNQLVFDTLYKEARNALDYGLDVVIDATNLTVKSRYKAFNALDPKHQHHRITRVFACPFSIAIQQDSERDRNVGQDVILNQVKRFEFPQYFEGIDEIEIVQNFGVVDSAQLYTKSIGYDQNTHYHKYTLDVHQTKVMQEIMSNPDYITRETQHMRTASIFHDYGKMFTRTLKDNGECSYPSHANVSAYLFMCSLRKEKIEEFKDEFLKTIFIINNHMKLMGKNVLEQTKEKYRSLWGDELYNDLLFFNKCDRIASGYKGE